MPGPPPKPVRLRELEGNAGHRPLRNEPKPRPITPAMPDYLGTDGQAKWNELLPELEYSGVLTIVDRDVFGLYCFAYQTFTQAVAELASGGAVVTAKGSGYMMPHPLVAIRNRAVDDMRRWGAELGVGAASRTRVDVRKPPAATKTALEAVREVTRRR